MKAGAIWKFLCDERERIYPQKMINVVFRYAED